VNQFPRLLPSDIPIEYPSDGRHDSAPMFVTSSKPTLLPSLLPIKVPSQIPSSFAGIDTSQVPNNVLSSVPKCVKNLLSLSSNRSHVFSASECGKIPRKKSSALPTLYPSSLFSAVPSNMPCVLPEFIPAALSSCSLSLVTSCSSSKVSWMVDSLSAWPVCLVPCVSSVMVSSIVHANVILPSPKEGEVVFPSHIPSDLQRSEMFLTPSEKPRLIPSASHIECPKPSPSPVPSKVSPIESPSPVPSMFLSPVLGIFPIYLPRSIPSNCPSFLPSVKSSKMSFRVPESIGTRLVLQVNDEVLQVQFQESAKRGT